MKQIRTYFFLSVLILLSITTSAQKKLHLYGRENYDVYLGCMTCSDLDSKSIWNDIGTYGSDISSYSPWNNLASYPPVIVDENGNFYGYFTTNTLNSKRTQIKLFVYILDNYKMIKENLPEYKKQLNF
jgi:hypothetical protein